MRINSRNLRGHDMEIVIARNISIARMELSQSKTRTIIDKLDRSKYLSKLYSDIAKSTQ